MTAKDLARNAYRKITAPVGSLQRIGGTPGEFVLSYDDGPDPRYTPEILEVLDRFNASATFFVLLSKVRRTGLRPARRSSKTNLGRQSDG